MDDEDRQQPLDPAKLLPYEKRIAPEDPEAIDAGRQFIRDSVTDATDVRI